MVIGYPRIFNDSYRVVQTELTGLLCFICLHTQFELVYFPNIWLTQKEQYRWLQVDYQIGRSYKEREREGVRQ